jgi:hypothetical protein
MDAICSSETSVDLNGLHGVISQKMTLFITTAVRTSNLTPYIYIYTIIIFREILYE